MPSADVLRLASVRLREDASMIPHLLPEFSRNLARALVEASAAPVLLLDKDLEVVTASASFCSAIT